MTRAVTASSTNSFTVAAALIEANEEVKYIIYSLSLETDFWFSSETPPLFLFMSIYGIFKLLVHDKCKWKGEDPRTFNIA